MKKFVFVKKALFLFVTILLLQSKSIEAVGKPIPIYNQKDLENIAFNLDGNFILMNDITISGTWKPIGSNDWGYLKLDNFKGVFDGNGHVIRNLGFNIRSGSYVGLFSINEGIIKNLGIENSVVSANLDESVNWFYLGFITGANFGTIENCYNSGSIELTSNNQEHVTAHVGGIAGEQALESTSVKSYNTGNISVSLKGIDGIKTVKIGGIVGGLFEGNGDRKSEITHCYNTGNITGMGTNVMAAGIAGAGSLVECCYNTGGIKAYSDSIYSGEESRASGIVTKGTVNKCYNLGSIKGITHGGGIIAGEGDVNNCFNAGSVDSVTYAGGISCSLNSHSYSSYYPGSITNSYNTGAVYGKTSVGIGFKDDGSIFNNNYSLKTLTGNCRDDEFTLTSLQMEIKESYKGFDFDKVWTMSSDLRHPFPVLKELIPPIYDNTTDFAGGNGTLYNPYKISTKEHLDNVRNYSNANYILINDISFETSDFALNGKYYNGGYGWNPICQDRYITDCDFFSGIFDGNGFAIANIYVGHKNENGGLFGVNYGIIKDLAVINANVNGQHAGIITGRNENAQLINCYSTGSVFAETSGSTEPTAGGICGSNGGFIKKCYSMAAVLSKGDAGGIAGFGYNFNGISDCIFTGNVSGNTAGGIVGRLSLSSVVNSINIGTVKASISSGGIVGQLEGSLVKNCYYNNTGLKAVGYYDSGDVNAKFLTPQELKQKHAYPGFDFNQVWNINDNMDYPLLKWVKDKS